MVKRHNDGHGKNEVSSLLGTTFSKRISKSMAFLRVKFSISDDRRAKRWRQVFIVPPTPRRGKRKPSTQIRRGEWRSTLHGSHDEGRLFLARFCNNRAAVDTGFRRYTDKPMFIRSSDVGMRDYLLSLAKREHVQNAPGKSHTQLPENCTVIPRLAFYLKRYEYTIPEDIHGSNADMLGDGNIII